MRGCIPSDLFREPLSVHLAEALKAGFPGEKVQKQGTPSTPVPESSKIDTKVEEVPVDERLRCGSACYCGGDVDDIETSKPKRIARAVLKASFRRPTTTTAGITAIPAKTPTSSDNGVVQAICRRSNAIAACNTGRTTKKADSRLIIFSSSHYRVNPETVAPPNTDIGTFPLIVIEQACVAVIPLASVTRSVKLLAPVPVGVPTTELPEIDSPAGKEPD